MLSIKSIQGNIKDYFSRPNNKELIALRNEFIKLKESYRSLESSQWVAIGGQTANSFIFNKWKNTVRDSRAFYDGNPLYLRAIILYTAFVFGKGATFTPKEEKLIELVQKFTEDADNQKCLFSSFAQTGLSNKLLKDGELFFMFFVDTEGRVVTRLSDPLQISQIIGEPNDPQTELYYVRDVIAPKYDFKKYDITANYNITPKKLIYRSIEYLDYVNDSMRNEDMLNKHSDETDDCYIYHVIAPGTDVLDPRGMPPFATAIPWARHNKRLHQVLQSYIEAITKIIWKKIVKGSSIDLTAAKTSTENDFHHELMTAISMEAEGGDEMQPVERSGNLGAVIINGLRQQKLMVCAGTGLPEPYFGDPETGNLATSTSMELPTLKVMEQWQEFWKGTYKRIFDFYFKINKDKTGKDIPKTMDITFPDILTENVPAVITAIAQARGADIIDGKTASQLALTTLGVNNITETLDEMYPEGEEVNPENQPSNELQTMREIQRFIRILEKKIK